jgi:hypothetical protein
MPDFKISRFKYTWRGNWSSATRYNPDDVVNYGGKVFTCLESHVAQLDFYGDFYNVDNQVPPQDAPRWLKIADGVSWKGDWELNTYYKEGDVVKVGGRVYVCSWAHTSPSTPTDPLTGLPVTLLAPEQLFVLEDLVEEKTLWVTQLRTENWTKDWTPVTWYNVEDIVRYGGRVYRCIASHQSSADINSGLESNIGEWQLVEITDDWKGNWIPATRYKANDIVKWGGRVYRCTIDHISASTLLSGLPADIGNWVLAFDGVDAKGSWAASTIYKVGDVVRYGSYVYKANLFHQSSSSFDSSKWDVFCPGNEFDSVWNLTTYYQQGDIVRYGGNLYLATTQNVGSIPTALSTWEKLFENTRMQGTWSQLINYKLGDVVRRGGNVYLALIDSVNQDPDLPNDGSSTNSNYWDLLIPGVKWTGFWASGSTYAVGDLVVYIASTYRCIDQHVANTQNSPVDDFNGIYWQAVTVGNSFARLRLKGDMRVYGLSDDGSTIGSTRLAIGTEGYSLKTTNNGIPEWKEQWTTPKAYYVAPWGLDDPSQGTTPNSPWRTIRYACENITGYASVFVRTGLFEEVLPIRVPAFVAVIGDELRGTIVKPISGAITPEYVGIVLSASEYLFNIIDYIIRGLPIGTNDPFSAAFGTTKRGIIAQNQTAGNIATAQESLIAQSLLTTFQNLVTTYTLPSKSGTNTYTVNANRLKAIDAINANRAFIKNELTLYIEETYADSTFVGLPATWSSDVDRILNALTYDFGYVGNFKTTEAGTYFINASVPARNQLSDMFYMQDGTGLRNMTLTGLSGTLGPITASGTRRPTAGAFVSLDPGYGPTDTSAWVGTKSPYIQNVTTFGNACVGLKIDGDLHAGGNQTIVCNDFTQILSDGVGVWCNGTGRSECVSVFTYYNHISYLCTFGGKIRGTNGNSSYGQWGAVSEGFNISEAPITASVNNRYYEADVAQIICDNNFGIQKLFYTNAGVNYTNATYTLTAAGLNASLIQDDFRDGGVYELRITDPGDSSAAGGASYAFNTNTSQGGTTTSVTLAGSDINTAAYYRNLRIIITQGTGVGQLGYIAEYDFTGKIVYVGRDSVTPTTATRTFNPAGGNLISLTSVANLTIGDPIMFTGTKFGNVQDLTVYYVRTIDTNANQITISALANLSTTFGLLNATGTMTVHTLGWEQMTPGIPIIAALDNSTTYTIEPRVTFSAPGYIAASAVLPATIQWSSVAASNSLYVAVAYATNLAYYSSNGTSWATGTLPFTALWNKVKFVNGWFYALAQNTQFAARSQDGITWSQVTLSTTVEDWRDITYGNGFYIAVAAEGTLAVRSSNGTTFSDLTLPEGADWNAIEFGKNRFVTVAQSDSSAAAVAYSLNNGTTWTLGSISGGCIDLAYGNNRFVAMAGGYAGAATAYYSLDGITWTTRTVTAANWQAITYAQGVFVGVARASNQLAVSGDGITWTYQNIGSSAPWCGIAYSSGASARKFLAITGISTNTNVAALLQVGCTARARARVVANKISAFYLYDPGANYQTAPIVTITDPNRSSSVTFSVRVGNGVLAQPTIANAGTGYQTANTSAAVSGDGYKDAYQLGTNLVVSGLTRIPGPGDNVAISGIDDYTYKLLSTTLLGGTVGNYTALLKIAKDLNRDESPDHGTAVSIRQNYSQVRLTGHDFLDVGLGNFIETNYPLTLYPNGTVLAPENEVNQFNGGRVFYTSTDQDGNFRVGELFSVEQSTGIVTLSSQFFSLQGLSELKLGGVTVGGTGVVIREFSTDVLFTADSNNVVPTQKAIKTYIQRRVSGGGADAVTGQVIAGLVKIGPANIDTTDGSEVQFGARVNFTKGVDGDFLISAYFMSTFTSSSGRKLLGR